MTKQEAIRILEHFEKQVFVKEDNSVQLTTTGNAACNIAISALKELQQYKLIGTIDECQSAVIPITVVMQTGYPKKLRFHPELSYVARYYFMTITILSGRIRIAARIYRSVSFLR